MVQGFRGLGLRIQASGFRVRGFRYNPLAFLRMPRILGPET